jgi:hypothetical protein
MKHFISDNTGVLLQRFSKECKVEREREREIDGNGEQRDFVPLGY